MAEPRKRRRHSAEYRRDAARLVINSNRSLRDVGDELGLDHETLRRWVNTERAREEAGKVESQESLSARERLELEELRRRNAQLEKDVEFLKKASAFFAREYDR
ncbi:transposase [Nocardioides immobilis]|uniref:Transposase n=1 Tax=Nocardioides immobilis TaxID=2049295 RepID=A0A417Y0U1_9ACTN|nr:transposase [Nocardioides immobilis]RHW26177.1 transposase [Nocardioides immobilis]